MNRITETELKQRLKLLQENTQSGLTGPFTHSAPAGNMFSAPFREKVWMVDQHTVLKKTWSTKTGWTYFRYVEGEIE